MTRVGSWIVTRRSDGGVIGEFFTRKATQFFNQDLFLIEPAIEYLARINASIKADQAIAAKEGEQS